MGSSAPSLGNPAKRYALYRKYYRVLRHLGVWTHPPYLNEKVPYKNLEHALRTLYTQIAFVLHSFCALVNHILHMCAKCASQAKYWAHAQNVRRRRYTLQNVCSLRTILKICAQYVQFAHIFKKKKKKKKSSAPVAGHPSKHWAGPMFEYRWFQCGMVSDTYSYSRRPFICAATLPKVSVLKVFFHL